ncbi:MAG: polyprenyl synthetase family protein, partial [Actinomycetota bacterium]
SSETDLERYAEMIAAKTAALMSAATACGALIALEATDGHHQAMFAAYSRFGHHLGMAFQIRDDILGIWGTQADTGKPSGSDIRRRKKTLPILFALAHAVPEARARLAAIYERQSPVSAADERAVREALEGCNTRGFAESETKRYCELAVASLVEAGLTEAGRAEAGERNPFLWRLEQLTMFLARRSS